jgi:predicted glutamine amidotransferase
MCLIIHKPANVKVPKDVLQGALHLNEDGYGIMYAKDGKLTVEKSLKASWLVERLSQLNDLELVIHLRMRTHGKVDLDNCHPFTVTDDIGMVHNGIIKDYGDIDTSDTSEFVTTILKPMLSTSSEAYGSEAYTKVLERVIGTDNKMILMRSDGKVWSLNRCLGLEYNGVWLSNTYAWKVYTYTSTGTATTAAKVWEKAKERQSNFSSRDDWDRWENEDEYGDTVETPSNLDASDLFYLDYDTLINLIIKAPDEVADAIYEAKGIALESDLDYLDVHDKHDYAKAAAK